jgi:DNA (cytosine-5)-methyltransferase 1
MGRLNYIDLFAGAGGLSEGFVRAGFEPIAHVEMDEAACNTLRTRTAYHYLKSEKKFETYVSYLKGEINRQDLYSTVPSYLLDSVINHPIGSDFNPSIHKKIESQLSGKDVDLIIGGPPCQAYSLVGRARSANGMAGDPRNYLYIQYAKYLEKYSPKLFVFENVLGLKSAKDGLYLRNMENLFFKKGYRMKLFIVEANNFGVLQNRKRIIIIGCRKDLSVMIPDLESIKCTCTNKVKSLFEDLPKIQAGEGVDKFLQYRTASNDYLHQTHIRNGSKVLTQHIARPHTNQDKEIYRIAVEIWNTKRARLNYNDLPERLKTHQNRNSFFDRFKVVASDYIHPDIEQNRSITVREAARLQSFPDDYYFEGVKEGANRTAAFKQIGNAVPPLMAFEIANVIKKLLK